MELEQKIHDLRKKVEEAKSVKARREAQADQARGIHKAALESLQELGHDSPESALEEAQKLRSELAKTVDQVEQKLAEASA